MVSSRVCQLAILESMKGFYQMLMPQQHKSTCNEQHIMKDALPPSEHAANPEESSPFLPDLS